MPQTNMRFSNSSNGTMYFVDPTKHANKVTVSLKTSKKPRIDAPKGKEVILSRWTLASYDELALPAKAGGDPCDAGVENISIRTSVSSSVLNKEAMLAKLTIHIQNLEMIKTDLLNGIPLPQTITLIASAAE